MRQLLLHMGTERASVRRRQSHEKLLQPGEPPDDLVQSGLLSCEMQADQVVHGSRKKLEPGTAATPISRIIHSQNSRSDHPVNCGSSRNLLMSTITK